MTAAPDASADAALDRPSRLRPSLPWDPGVPGFARATWLFGRLLGVTYLVAFASLHVQLLGLLGSRGIRPAAELLALARDRLGERALVELPSLLWWTGAGDAALTGVCVAGEVAAAGLALGVAPGATASLCFALYLSLVSVGAPFLPLQWDTLLLEAGFLAVFLFGRFALDGPRRPREPPWPARWAVWFLAFRLHFASGVVKLTSGDPAWAGLRALEHHFETQPLPNPLSWWVDHLPPWWLAAGTGATLGLELVVPFGLLSGVSPVRHASALALVGLQVAIALTGNFGFFNLLSVALLLTFFDDAFAARVTPGRLRRALGWGSSLRVPPPRGWTAVTAAPALIVTFLAVVPLAGAVGAGRLVPDAAYDVARVVAPFRVANGYGLFAVMTTERPELVIEGSDDGETWEPYVFRYKPLALDRTPPQVAPHMPRLDWQLWFAALSADWQAHAWVVSLMERLLEAEPSVLALLADDPFEGRPPRRVRALLYAYEFAPPEARRREGLVWRRTPLGRWGPMLTRGAEGTGAAARRE